MVFSLVKTNDQSHDDFGMHSLAKRQNLDEDGLASIFTQYGDHLYGKGDHDGAIQQYIQTIGKLEASYVIRKVRSAVELHAVCVLTHVSTGFSCGCMDVHEFSLPLQHRISVSHTHAHTHIYIDY